MSRFARAFLVVPLMAAVARPAFGQTVPSTVVVELHQPGTVLQTTQRWANLHTYWTSRGYVCAAPCTVELPLDLTYTVGGEGIPTSATFSLPPRQRVLLDVKPGNSGVHDFAGVLTIAGGLATAGGGVTLLAGNSSTTVVGLAVLGAGLAALGLGIPLLLTSATTVTFD